jgi:hypothetical protein
MPGFSILGCNHLRKGPSAALTREQLLEEGGNGVSYIRWWPMKEVAPVG